MQFSTSTLLALVLSAMGTAYALPSGSGSMSTLAARGGGSCSTGNTQCCNTVQPASEPDTNSALSQANLLELVLKDLSIPVGLGCTPISVLGAGSGGNWWVAFWWLDSACH